MCPYCKGNHYLPHCEHFQAKEHEEKTSYILEAKRCFECLRTGHFSHGCSDRHKCRTCHRSHLTVLHREQETSSPAKQSQTSNQAETQQKANALSTCTGSSNTTNVIPVWISTKEKPRVEKLVYALLDAHSDSSFIEENLCSQLAAATEPCKLKLITLLGKDVTVECQKASSLRVRGYTSTHVIDLPPTYTRDSIPLDREHIPTCETAKNGIILKASLHKFHHCYLLGKGGYVFGSVGLSVCLSVCGQHYSKSYERIGVKFYGGVLGSIMKN